MRKGKKHLVIIGNGGASLSAIRAIRSVDSISPITVLSSEDCYAYSPVATTHYLAGDISRDQLFITDRSFYEICGVTILLKKKVLEVRPEISSVFTEDKERVIYDQLLIATGASPLLPSGIQDKQILSLRTLEDADRILLCARHLKKAVILGGGLVSLQLAQALWKRGLDVVLVVGSSQLLSKNLDYECASRLQKSIAERGIMIYLSVEVSSFENRRDSIQVRLSNGETISSALIISGKGMKPNLLEGPLSTDKDVIVDEHMRTRVENIFAAGDVSCGRHLISGQWERVANWPNACYQGWIAGLNMAGVEAKLDGVINHNVSDLFGNQLVSMGLFDPPKEKGIEILKWADEERNLFRKIVIKEGKVVGAILVNGIQDSGLIQSMILRKSDVFPSKIIFEGRLNMANFLRSHFSM